MHKQSFIHGLSNPLLVKPDRSLPAEVAIIGAGTIGPDIGYYIKSALPEVKLFLVDVADTPLKNARNRLQAYVKKALDRKKMVADKAVAVQENIVYTTDYNRIKNCDLVIEAATENIALKRKIFHAVETRVSSEAIITSNTSSIPAERLFGEMANPGRTTVTHFFAPAWRSLPVEVIAWKGGSRMVLDYLCWFFATTGKAPIVTADVICFMLDRIFDNWCNESAYLLNQATAGEIDAIARDFVFAGPFFVLNMANGNPIIVETNTLQMEEGVHYQPAPIFNSVDRWLVPGSKGGGAVAPELRKIVRDRILGILFSQSFDIVDRNIGSREDLNFGCQVALGFKNGPFDIMQDIGEAEVHRIMNEFAAARPGFPLPKENPAAYLDFKRYILTDEIEGVTIITIRRPQAMNALNAQMADEILDVLETCSQDPNVKGVILTGYGQNAFCAGADIGTFPKLLGDHDAAAQYAQDCARVQLFLDQMKKPVVAAISGFALGGGLELAIRCHGIVAVKTAIFQFPEITLGILPGIGGCIVPYRKWPQGASLFHDMICFGCPITAARAQEVGMVTEIADDYAHMIQAALMLVDNWVGKIQKISQGRISLPAINLLDTPPGGKSNLSPEALAITADTIVSGAAADRLADALEIGYAGFGRIACTPAAREGITAFLEKRKPVFQK
jgi:enoyl-CoA hydratase/3-hydroxyacyl-CoA dehydrogenase